MTVRRVGDDLDVLKHGTLLSAQRDVPSRILRNGGRHADECVASPSFRRRSRSTPRSSAWSWTQPSAR